MTGESKPAAAPPALDSDLSRRIMAAIAGESELKGARVGVHARRLGDPSPLVDVGGDQTFNSASNTKIITTAAALSLLGPEFQFTTGLWGDGISEGGARIKKLYLVGGADPSLGISDIQQLASDLAETGVQVVDRILVDDSYFDGNDLPPHFDEQPREDASFRAPVNAAGLGFNSFAIHVIPNPNNAGAARIILSPPVDYLHVVENAVTTVSRGRSRIRVEAAPRRGRLELRLRGQIRARAPRRIRQRVPEPNPFASSVLRWALKGAGIKVQSRSFRAEDAPPGARLLARRASQPLGVLVQGLGKYSNNYMAEMVLKTIGAETDDGDAPATWSVALEAVRNYLTETVGLGESNFVYENGSGLFESNAFTPAQIVQVLAVAATDPRISAELIASFAVAGTDGTLRSRMDDDAAGLVRAKTGTLATVSALSGFASSSAGGPPIVFSILVNDIEPGHVSAARSLQDKIATLLVEREP